MKRTMISTVMRETVNKLVGFAAKNVGSGTTSHALRKNGQTILFVKMIVGTAAKQKPKLVFQSKTYAINIPQEKIVSTGGF